MEITDKPSGEGGVAVSRPSAALDTGNDGALPRRRYDLTSFVQQ